jgi:AraC family transcriptional regulator
VRDAGFGAAALVARLAQMLEAARFNLDTDYEVTRRLVAEAYCLLELHLARSAGDEVRRSGKGSLARWQIDRVHTFIEEHLSDCIRVCELSAVARSSPSYFSCAFKKTFGASPQVLLQVRRRYDGRRATQHAIVGC